METNQVVTNRMFRFDQKMLDSYLKTDRILEYLQDKQCEIDTKFTTHQWLLKLPPKRLIHDKMYPELFRSDGTSLKILDVGGGYSSLTRQLAEHHNYTLLDTMPKEDIASLKKIAQEMSFRWVHKSWYDFQPQTYDVIIANDIFPNVDQRLDLFLKKYLPLCKILRMSITCYNIPKFYSVQRTDADEIFHIQPWDGEQTKRVLSQYTDRIEKENFGELCETENSLFENKRQVYSITFRGDLS